MSAQARSQQQLDTATASQRATAATVDAQLKRADAMHAQVKAAQTTVNAALASVNAAQSQVEQAELDLGYCKVIAGHRGRVTRRRVEVGNYVEVAQEVLDVVPTDVPDVWVTANFKESQLAHMQRGQHVVISVDAFPDQKLHGHIDSVQNGTGGVFSLLPPENATGNYVKVVQRVPVKIVIDDKPRHMLSPGLSVEPEVDISARPDVDGSQTNADRSAAARPPRGRDAVPVRRRTPRPPELLPMPHSVPKVNPWVVAVHRLHGDVHGGARHVHRQRRPAVHRRRPGQQLRRVDLDADHLPGLQRRHPAGQRVAVQPHRPQAVLHGLRGPVHDQLVLLRHRPQPDGAAVRPASARASAAAGWPPASRPS